MRNDGFGATPPTTINTGAWVDALTATYNSSGYGSKALIANVSAVTAILTGDLRATNSGVLFLNWGGVQARVLVDCTLPTCDSTIDAVPTKNMLAPGVIVMDQAAHFYLETASTNQSDIALALDLTAGARSFNFFLENVGRSKSHNVKFQVKFNAGGINGTPDVISGGLAAVAKRTMILQSMSLHNESR